MGYVTDFDYYKRESSKDDKGMSFRVNDKELFKR